MTSSGLDYNLSMRTENPFSRNPFTSTPAVKLLTVPEAPETHEQQKPMRSYLSAGSGAGILDGLTGSPRRGPRSVERLKVVYRDQPQSGGDDDGGEESPKFARA